MIRLENLTMEYGSVKALKGVSLEVGKGALVGLIGPNGAGKTTAMKILATLLEPTSGDAFVDGHSAVREKDQVRGLIGYMPDFFGVYRDMRVGEYLAFFAAAYGVPKKKRPQIVGDLLSLVDLEPKRDALIDTLSRGMQQRLGLARVLVHDPRVLILDEPASGLDPRARIDIREILKELVRMGKTILLSSHILPELGEICTQIAIVERGNLVAFGTLPELVARAQAGRAVRVRVGDLAAAQTLLAQHAAARAVRSPAVTDGPIPPTVATELIVELADGAEPADLAQALVQGGQRLFHLAEETPSLEEVFLRLTAGAEPGPGAPP